MHRWNAICLLRAITFQAHMTPPSEFIITTIKQTTSNCFVLSFVHEDCWCLFSFELCDNIECMLTNF